MRNILDINREREESFEEAKELGHNYNESDLLELRRELSLRLGQNSGLGSYNDSNNEQVLLVDSVTGKIQIG